MACVRGSEAWCAAAASPHYPGETPLGAGRIKMLILSRIACTKVHPHCETVHHAVNIVDGDTP